MAHLFSKVSKSIAYFGGAALIVSTQKLQAKDSVACHDCHKKRLPKAKELPLYDEDDFKAERRENSPIPLLSEISSLRKQISQYTSYINTLQEQATHVYETGVSHTKSTFEHLKNEDNKVQRVMIIAFGGLIGLIYARKGGILKKVLFTSLGTGITFSMFYPAVSKEYAVLGFDTTKLQINNILVKYGGYDTDKMADEANAKIEFVKSVMKVESIMNKFNQIFKHKDMTPNKDEVDKANERENS